MDATKFGIGKLALPRKKLSGVNNAEGNEDFIKVQHKSVLYRAILVETWT